ncbi:MAG: RNA polymerase sigma factor [Mangrovibacterium sp.]
MESNNFNSALVALQEPLYRYALSLTNDSESAHDLLQETFLKALTYRERFKSDTNFKAWIYTIMKNSFINNYRRNVRVRSTFEQQNKEYFMGISVDESFESPDSHIGAKDISNEISSLTDEYRVPFQMYLSGYKYQEISNELHLPLGTVKSRIFFGRKKLEKTLASYTE